MLCCGIQGPRTPSNVWHRIGGRTRFLRFQVVCRRPVNTVVGRLEHFNGIA